MNANTKMSIAALNKMRPDELIENEGVQNRFVTLYDKVHGQNAKNGELIFNAEKFFFLQRISENPVLAECTGLSLYGVILDVAVNRLSLDKTKNLLYITSRNANAGTKDNPKWEKRAELLISPYGELALRQMNGQIKHADNPIIVYEGDEFSVEESGEGKNIHFKAMIPRKSNKIIASFIRIARTDGKVDYFYLTMDDVNRFKAASQKQNSRGGNEGKPNALYTSWNGQIDPGFLAAKTIKHAFKAYPKVKVGKFSKLMPEDEEEEEIDYGIVDDQGKEVKVEKVAEPEQPATSSIQDIDHEDVAGNQSDDNQIW